MTARVCIWHCCSPVDGCLYLLLTQKSQTCLGQRLRRQHPVQQASRSAQEVQRHRTSPRSVWVIHHAGEIAQALLRSVTSSHKLCASTHSLPADQPLMALYSSDPHTALHDKKGTLEHNSFSKRATSALHEPLLLMHPAWRMHVGSCSVHMVSPWLRSHLSAAAALT